MAMSGFTAGKLAAEPRHGYGPESTRASLDMANSLVNTDASWPRMARSIRRRPRRTAASGPGSRSSQGAPARAPRGRRPPRGGGRPVGAPQAARKETAEDARNAVAVLQAAATVFHQ